MCYYVYVRNNWPHKERQTMFYEMLFFAVLGSALLTLTCWTISPLFAVVLGCVLFASCFSIGCP